METLIVDNALQEKASQIFKSMGLTTSEAVEWFFKEVINDFKPKRNSEAMTKFADSFKGEEMGFKTEDELSRGNF
ncbi:MAG: type II toxin-antitoxin system RelB/DinJ family antitoxin [Selenomonadaceae bacterium]|nr:type II toxin-antitoxin system RelB/DinJ family antitoxin [Selenomonadaceae bacterium]MBP3722432.1 type II toxin-antitoxin system RelB/DinJ family antitoxin [Selenomonadaceae bacterium]